MQSTATSGSVALIVRAMSSVTLTRSARPTPADLAEVAADLGGIDVDGADNGEALAGGDLPDDARADRAESDVHDFDGHWFHSLRQTHHASIAAVFAAFLDGWRRVLRARVLSASVVLAILLLAVPLGYLSATWPLRSSATGSRPRRVLSSRTGTSSTA